MESLHGVRESGTVDERVQRLLVACIDVVAVDGAGVSLKSGGSSREPLYGTNDTATMMERLQFTLGEGPCVDASATGSPVLVDDLRAPQAWATERWPAFLAEVLRAGVLAVFAFPLRIGAISLGAIDLHRLAPGPLSSGDMAKTLSVVDAITLTVLDGDTLPEVGTNTNHMSNLVVHRAAGMVMVQIGCSIEEALVRLRGAAYAEGVPIHLLATEVVQGRRRFEKEQE